MRIKIYVVITEDRYCDITCDVYSTLTEAMDAAAKIAYDSCRTYPKNIESIPENRLPDGCYAAWSWSHEGDIVTVHEKDMELPKTTHSHKQGAV